jgi:heme/copper-type cytochrome/quinol oxidase subunit 4
LCPCAFVSKNKTKQNMQKHKTTILFLVLYYIWFAYVGWHIATGADNEGEVLRLSTMIIISVVLAGVYLCVFLFRMFASKESGKENFLFLWLITLPIIIGAVYHIINV